MTDQHGITDKGDMKVVWIDPDDIEGSYAAIMKQAEETNKAQKKEADHGGQ